MERFWYVWWRVVQFLSEIPVTVYVIVLMAVLATIGVLTEGYVPPGVGWDGPSPDSYRARHGG